MIYEEVAMDEKIEITHQELQLLISETVRQNKEKDKEKKRKLWFDILRATLTPLVIAIVGWQATLHINQRQLENTKLLAEKQIEAANIRADKEIESTNLRSTADREIEKLTQIEDIFQKIIGSDLAEQNLPEIKLLISSLEIYDDQSLAFLINIRDYYIDQGKQKISNFANESILNILKASQPNFSGYNFIGKPDELLNLRLRKFIGYNFSNSLFKHVNLYNAQFNKSTLQKVIFEDVDLYGADFFGANLSGSTFSANTNLRRTNFVGAKLKESRFKECKYLEDAQFSFAALLKADELPFSEVSRTDYINLLVRHRSEIETLHKGDPQRLQPLLNKSEYEYDELMQRLKEKQFAKTGGQQPKEK
jgi:uncharacterized protein YjbI with pentapeptide repeats